MRKFSRFYLVIMVATIILISALCVVLSDSLRNGFVIGVIFGFVLGSALESYWRTLFRESGVHES